jgi:phospholipase C
MSKHLRPTLALLIGATFALALVVNDDSPATAASTKAPAVFDPSVKIKHVVIILKENQSFNAILGPWCARHPARGCRGDDIGTREPTSTVASVALKQGPDIVPQVDHSGTAQRLAWNNGANDGWDKISGGFGDCKPGGAIPYKCYQAYTPAQVPNVTRYAGAFALSDATRTCQMQASWNDKLTWTSACDQHGFRGDNPKPEAGTLAADGLGCQSNKVTPWSADGRTFSNQPSCIPDYSTGLAFGGAFRATPVPAQHDSLFENCDGTPGCTWIDYNTARLWSPAAMRAYSVYKHPHYSTPAKFLTDAAAGRLPSISFVTESLTGKDDSFHNGNSVTVGDNSVGKEVAAVMNGPAWASTAIFLTWDDCGCFYDPIAPNRVPMILVSPYAKAGFTDHTLTTFAGVQRFTELTFGLPSMNANDANAYPYANAFDFAQRPLPPVKATTATVPAASAYTVAHPALIDGDDS